MATSDTFLAEMETKSTGPLDRLGAAFREVARSEGFSLADVLRIEVKHTLEAMEYAALWLVDTDTLAFKLALADLCGGGARRYGLLAGRLTALGVDINVFDPLVLGYSKLFASLRSMQTTEERAAAMLMLGRFAMQRFAHAADLAAAQGDAETASLCNETLPVEEDRTIDAARKALLLHATGEENQARARRASFRVIELSTELLDSTLVRKYLSRSLKKVG